MTTAEHEITELGIRDQEREPTSPIPLPSDNFRSSPIVQERRRERPVGFHDRDADALGKVDKSWLLTC